MKTLCRTCLQPIERVRGSWWHHGSAILQSHSASPRDTPKVAPPTESELRALYGDR